MSDVLELFDPKTSEWFRTTLGSPTPVQEEAWPAIADGQHTLVSAPTGTGKTLSAFLVFLDRLKRQAREGTLKQELQLIYVSPLKSLAGDIRENLKRPLDGIDAEEQIHVAVRTGDTTQKERQQMLRRPPHILITTPESLYLLLTGKNSQKLLATARAVILDELHVMIDTKRGAHLMLSLARLDRLCGKPLQRIGLSATMEPLDLAARYLAPEPVTIAAPKMKKQVELQVMSPFADQQKGRRKDPIWEELASLVYRYCQGNRSVIAFVEGRRYAEKLAYYVNLIGGEDFARVHHGSLSKEQRSQVEESLRNGSLRLLCATSSMELGIDVGEIDQVLQVGCPRTVSGTMQRLGRAGHNPGRTSVMYLFPRTAGECVSCGMTAQLAREGGVERLSPPRLCLDILAQHLVSMAAVGSYHVDDVLEILTRAWPFRDVTRDDVKSTLCMLAGDYEHDRDIPARPRLLYDRIHECVEGDPYSRMLAVSAGGTIPDKGLFAVKTEGGVKLGEVDEEFVYESRKGDRFILGSFAWKILEITRDTVTVTQTPIEGARLPFWHGELKGRNKATGEAFGRILRSLQEADENGKLLDRLSDLGLDEAAVSQAQGYLKRQIAATGGLPDDRTVIVEHFRDNSGNSQIMIHSVFGKKVNSPLAMLAAQAAMDDLGRNVGFVDEEDGILLYSYSEETLPEGILGRILPERCEEQLSAMLPATPLFNIAFRYNSGRALMMGVRKNQRQPLWMQRLRSAEMLDQLVRETEHPLIRETRRECMEDLWDIEGLKKLLYDIRSGAVAVREISVETPSPMSLPLQWGQEAAVMYDYAPTPRGVHAAVEDALRAEKLSRKEKNYLLPGAEELSKVQERTSLPQTREQLHTLLMTEGDLAAGELEIPVEWLETLAREERALYLEQGLWIAAEHAEEYRAALMQCSAETFDLDAAVDSADTETVPIETEKARRHIVRRMLRYRGGASVAQTAERYGWTKEAAETVLTELCQRDEAVLQDGIYYHAILYSRARTRTVQNRRTEISTVPAENYSALILSRITENLTGEESLRKTLKLFAGCAFPAAMWESILFPARVKNYRENLLDQILSEGELFWHMEPGGMLRFDFQEEIDWEADLAAGAGAGKEAVIYRALQKRGASFMQSLNGLLPGESPHETLLSLMEKGLVYADSFVPVRQWLSRDKQRKNPSARQRVNMRVKALNAGRWDLVRPLKKQQASTETTQSDDSRQLERIFDRFLILSRETAAACGVSWQEALNILRVQEYTGQVRRGYFVEGLSGAQFIRSRDFESVTAALKNPAEKNLWLNAADPAQLFGKVLQHRDGCSFLNVPGTLAAFQNGRPAAVFERQGKIFRVLPADDPTYGEDCGNAEIFQLLKLFSEEYKKGKLYANQKRVVVKEYPEHLAKAFEEAGFIREMQDYVLYR